MQNIQVASHSCGLLLSAVTLVNTLDISHVLLASRVDLIFELHRDRHLIYSEVITELPVWK